MGRPSRSQTLAVLAMRVLEAYVVKLPWIQRNRWKSCLTKKAGRPWLEDDCEARKRTMLQWLSWADKGDAWHRDEELWLTFEDRHQHFVLLANYIDQQFEALRLELAPAIDLNAMD